jgi:hypothetical protein
LRTRLTWLLMTASFGIDDRLAVWLDLGGLPRCRALARVPRANARPALAPERFRYGVGAGATEPGTDGRSARRNARPSA